MKIFVINLARSKERRACIERQLKKLNLEYEIFEAVDGSALSYAQVLRNTKTLNYAVSSGEIGCSLSHINIYRKMVAEDIPQALILEDDALLSSQTVTALQMLEALSIQTPTVTLLTQPDHYLSKPVHDGGIHAIHQVLEATCSHGYVINCLAAQRLIDFLYPVWMVADKWQTLKEYSVCDITAVIPPVIEKTALAECSTIKNDIAYEKHIVQKKSFIWKELKKHRSLKIKLKRAMWTLLVLPFLNISK